MAKRRPPHLRAQKARRTLNILVGSNTAKLSLLVGVVALSWFGNGTRDLYQALTRLEPLDWIPLTIDLIAFPAIVIVLLYLSRSASEEVIPVIAEDVSPPPVRALVLFLSPPLKGGEFIADVISNKSAGRIRDAGFREAIPGPWRMPIEAIAHHLAASENEGRLEHVIVIPSADRFDSEGQSHGGTYRDVNTFVDFAQALISAETDSSKVTISSVFELLSAANREEHRPKRNYTNGVDFESAGALVDAVNDALRVLQRKMGVAIDDVLVDVTGGQKVPTVAGAVVSLAEGRRFQYVSTHDFRIRTYNVTYGQ